MLNVHIRHVFLVVLLMYLSVSSCNGFRSASKGYSSKYDGKGYKEPSKSKTVQMMDSSSSNINQNTTRKGLGISAWGLITLIVSLILVVTGMYYFSICYPILCKKTRKYDMIGLPDAV